MNEIVRTISGLPTTQAAEGVPRLRWTTAQLIHLTELGVFRAEDRFELIGGEIVPMSPTGRRHEVVAEEIEKAFDRAAAPGVFVRTERQFNLDDDTYCKPDIFVIPDTIRSYDVRGNTVLLIVEVAKSSLEFDLGTKAATYAKLGVREYWVVNADTLDTRIHTKPNPSGFAETHDIAPNQTVTPLLVPQLALSMSQLDLL